jgi:hypothetical protein
MLKPPEALFPVAVSSAMISFDTLNEFCHSQKATVIVEKALRFRLAVLLRACVEPSN